MASGGGQPGKCTDRWQYATSRTRSPSLRLRRPGTSAPLDPKIIPAGHQTAFVVAGQGFSQGTLKYKKARANHVHFPPIFQYDLRSCFGHCAEGTPWEDIWSLCQRHAFGGICLVFGVWFLVLIQRLQRRSAFAASLCGRRIRRPGSPSPPVGGFGNQGLPRH
jgi:hypothetical protein